MRGEDKSTITPTGSGQNIPYMLQVDRRLDVCTSLAAIEAKTAIGCAETMQDGQLMNYEHEYQESIITSDRWDANLWTYSKGYLRHCCMATWCPCVSIAHIEIRLGASFEFPLLLYGTLVCGILVFIGVALSNSEVAGSIPHPSPSSSSADDYYYAPVYTSSYLPITVAVLLVGVYLLGVQHIRSKTRRTFNIPGSMREDFYVSCFCSCCAIAQMTTHTKCYKGGLCAFHPVNTLPAYSL